MQDPDENEISDEDDENKKASIKKNVVKNLTKGFVSFFKNSDNHDMLLEDFIFKDDQEI
jgi:hypothetical protein